jgi:hypothetical protein
MKYLIIFVLFSCSNNYSVHESNLQNQYRTMMKHDKRSRKKQQAIRDKRERVLFRNKKNKNTDKYIY